MPKKESEQVLPDDGTVWHHEPDGTVWCQNSDGSRFIIGPAEPMRRPDDAPLPTRPTVIPKIHLDIAPTGAGWGWFRNLNARRYATACAVRAPVVVGCRRPVGLPVARGSDRGSDDDPDPEQAEHHHHQHVGLTAAHRLGGFFTALLSVWG